MANEVYISESTAVLFGSEAGDDVAWTTESVADAAGRQSAFHDLGAAPRPFLYRFRFWTQFNAAPTVGAAIRLYAKTAEDSGGSPAHPDNDDGTGDIAVSAEDKLRNLENFATLSVDEASLGVEMVASGVVALYARHLSVVLWNASGAALSSTASHTKLRLTPIAEQLQ